MKHKYDTQLFDMFSNETSDAATQTIDTGFTLRHDVVPTSIVHRHNVEDVILESLAHLALTSSDSSAFVCPTQCVVVGLGCQTTSGKAFVAHACMQEVSNEAASLIQLAWR